jgi:F0F1-type ATP synthase assembly protein I
MADQEDPRQLGLYFAMAQVGFEMVVPIVAGVFLDNWWGTSPWMVALGAVLGLVGGLYHLIVLLNRFNKPRPPS